MGDNYEKLSYRELDALVVERVMGFWQRGTNTAYDADGNILWQRQMWNSPDGKCGDHLWVRPSTNIADAWQVVEKMRDKGFGFTIECDGRGAWEVFLLKEGTDGPPLVYTIDESAPRAICIAALRVLDPEVK